jgi:hypothetical protein
MDSQSDLHSATIYTRHHDKQSGGSSLTRVEDCYVVSVPMLGVLCRMEESQHFDSCTYRKWPGGGHCRHYDGAAMVVGDFSASIRSNRTIVNLVTWLW